MSYKIALAALAICMVCGPALAQTEQTPSGGQGAAPPPVDLTSKDREACDSDVKKLCNEVVNPRPGDNRVLTCLIKHEKELTEACRKNVDLHRKVLNQQ